MEPTDADRAKADECIDSHALRHAPAEAIYAIRDRIARALADAREEGYVEAYDHVARASDLPGESLRTITLDHGIVDGARKIELRKAAPYGYVIDDQGVVRLVLGSLPLTMDGCLAGYGAVVYHESGAKWHQYLVASDTHRSHELVAGQCYSTRAAAEAAKGTT